MWTSYAARVAREHNARMLSMAILIREEQKRTLEQLARIEAAVEQMCAPMEGAAE